MIQQSSAMTPSQTRLPSPEPQQSAYRWRICALLFFATTINYLDRQVLGVLAPDLQKVIGWNELQYGYIVTCFQAAYALGLVTMGRVIDRTGTRVGYALAILIWSLAAMAHSLVSTVVGFAVVRFVLGFGEAGNFPAALKTVSEWFTAKERSFATGIFNSGTNVGAILAPLLVPVVTVRFGWRAAFVFTGVFSAAWLIAWLLIYRKPAGEVAVGAQGVAWGRMVASRQAWAFLAGKLLTDPFWWFYLFWLPKFLNSRHGLSLTELGLPLVVIYLAADAGSIAGGWLASPFIKRGWTVNRARKTAMACCAVAVTPVMFAAYADDLWVAVGLISLAVAAHQGWSVNLLTLPSDLFPRESVASVVGFGGLGGAIGGMMISNVVGFLLEFTHSYVPVFVLAGSAYPGALAVIHLLVPRMERVGLKPAAG